MADLIYAFPGSGPRLDFERWPLPWRAIADSPPTWIDGVTARSVIVDARGALVCRTASPGATGRDAKRGDDLAAVIVALSTLPDWVARDLPDIIAAATGAPARDGLSHD